MAGIMGDDLSRALNAPMTRIAGGVALLALFGLAFAAWLNGSVVAIGGCCTLALIGIAVATGSAARSLAARADIVENRELPAPIALATARPRGAFIAFAWASAAAVVLVALAPIRALRGPPAPRGGSGWTPGARLVRGDGTPVNVNDLEIGSIETVFPEGKTSAAQAATVLLRLAEPKIHTAPERRSWSPAGYMAFSKICTHAGCPVAVYLSYTAQLYCPCHQSTFDCASGAKPVAGPATQPLAQLALAIDAHGQLYAQHDFVDPVGPEGWSPG
jgi:ubiquinol-cytochrome c reductase iron-sulfur subunit